MSASFPTSLLLSGGVDSAACAALLNNNGASLSALFIDYGQRAAAAELTASQAIAEHYGIPHRSFQLTGASSKPTGLICGRNAFLLFSALVEGGATPRSIAIGIHSGTPYFDCSQAFIGRVQALFDNYSDGAVRVIAPFVDWVKPDIWAYSVKNGVPLELTYSCEQGGPIPCGVCPSCRDLEALRAG